MIPTQMQPVNDLRLELVSADDPSPAKYPQVGDGLSRPSSRYSVASPNNKSEGRRIPGEEIAACAASALEKCGRSFRADSLPIPGESLALTAMRAYCALRLKQIDDKWSKSGITLQEGREHQFLSTIAGIDEAEFSSLAVRAGNLHNMLWRVFASDLRDRIAGAFKGETDETWSSFGGLLDMPHLTFDEAVAQAVEIAKNEDELSNSDGHSTGFYICWSAPCETYTSTSFRYETRQQLRDWHYEPVALFLPRSEDAGGKVVFVRHPTLQLTPAGIDPISGEPEVDIALAA